MSESFNKNEFIKVAYYYYKKGMTQDEIAKKMSISRQRINRILKKCLETGIVTIIIQEYDNQYVEFETQIESLTGLKEVIIANSDDGEINESLGAAASSYLERVIKDNDVIGFSRGRALSYLVKKLIPLNKKNLTVTQLVGGLNAEETNVNSDDIVRNSAQILNATPYFLYAPIIVENKELRDTMLNEAFISQVYNKMQQCSVALVGIGDMSNKSAWILKSFLLDKEYSFLSSSKAVGEICTHYYDINGNIIESDINDRVFAINYPNYKNIPLRIGIGGGEEKIDAITGAIRGNLINVLITDLKTSKELLKVFINR